MFLQKVAKLILDCARRTSTAVNLNIRSILCAAFREQEDDQAASPHLACGVREHGRSNVPLHYHPAFLILSTASANRSFDVQTVIRI